MTFGIEATRLYLMRNALTSLASACLATLCCGCHSHKWLGMTSKSEHNRQALPAYGMGISSDLCGLTLEISSE